MADSKHTPTPWRYVPWHIEEGADAVRAPDGTLVCTTSGGGDASLIVRAVNERAELLAALEGERDYWERRVRSWKDMPSDHPGTIEAHEHFTRLDALLQRASASEGA